MRVVVGIEYDGTEFCGWQSQQGSRTVQDEVQKALSYVANEEIQVSCAGRTDSGVHAYGQVIHFDTSVQRSERSWVLGCNSNLPKDINISWAKETESDFHARFGATSRRYRYVIMNRFTRSAILQNRVCWHHQPLDVSRMQEAAQHFIGEHDFTSFRALACQAKHAIRTMHILNLHRQGDYIFIDVQANAFLHHMVRNIVGTLLAIGEGEEDPAWVKSLLAAKDRSAAGITSSAQGLYLVSVQYPDKFAIPGVELPPGFV